MAEAIGIACLVALLVGAAIWALTLRGKVERTEGRVYLWQQELKLWKRECKALEGRIDRERAAHDADLAKLRRRVEKGVDQLRQVIEQADRFEELAHLFMEIHPGLADAFMRIPEGCGSTDCCLEFDWDAVETYKKGLQAVEEFEEYHELQRKIQNNGKKEGPVEADS